MKAKFYNNTGKFVIVDADTLQEALQVAFEIMDQAPCRYDCLEGVSEDSQADFKPEDIIPDESLSDPALNRAIGCCIQEAPITIQNEQERD
jgi:hypothetical protein